MEYELYHHGIKGMRWGIRRYQKDDGSLTVAGRQRYGKSKQTPQETIEEKRARLLKSTNANELYKNRDLLTTDEIKERMNRINEEEKLKDLAAKNTKSAQDYISKFVSTAKTVDEVYKATFESNIGKALLKKFGLDKTVEQVVTAKSVLKNPSKYSDKQIQDAYNRTNNLKNLKNLLDNKPDASVKKSPNKSEVKVEDLDRMTNQELIDLLNRLRNQEDIARKLT